MMEEPLRESETQPPIAQEEYNIIKSAPKETFDDITFLATQVCNTPIALFSVSIHDETWIQSCWGIEQENIPFSGILHPRLEAPGIFFSKDINSRKLFREPPDLGNFEFIAGIPLISPEGHSIGILYALDHHEKELNHSQKNALEILGVQIIKLLEFKKQTDQLTKVQEKLNQKYNDLEKFASVVSHDIKSPLANIISLTEFLKEGNQDTFDEESKQYLDFLIQSSYSLRNYVDGILTFYRSDHVLEKEKEDVDLKKFFGSIALLYQVNPNVVISYPTTGSLHRVNKAALTQIFLNLVSNALKYNNKQVRKVEISFEEEESCYLFEVRDNGNGIPQHQFQKIFDLFATLDNNDRDGNPGSGIGLATVKKMLEHMEGTIEVESKIGEGSNFKFRIKRK